MSIYTYTPTLTPESDESYIVKREFVVVDCTPQLPVGSCDLFNAMRCGNDECYAQPFISGDILTFQWRFSMPLSMVFSFAPTLVDEDFNTIAYAVPLTTFGVGYDSNYQTYQWLNIDTSLIPENVNYFHLKLIYGPNNDEWFSEPFERVKCDDQTILVVAAHNSGVDCFKNYHNGLPNYVQSVNFYNSQTRIWGTLEKISNGITKEITEDVEISTTVEQIFTLRTSRKVPQYVADKLAECFTGRIVYIDGVVYTGGSKIDKDFDEGKSWIITCEVKQTCTKDNFACD